MSSGLLLIVSAPSGAGKTSLVNALLGRDPRLALSISHTTRPRRPKEQDGVNYHFVDRDTFVGMVERGGFLEYAEVFGHLYGTSLEAVARQRAGGQDVILEIDYQGARQIRARHPDAVGVFIIPPSKATLAQRLEHRGEDAPGVIRERLAKARTEMSHYADYDYLVVNDDFETALGDIAAILRAERSKVARQRARLGELLDELLSDP